ncbi:MAG TPA: hypothetical protein VM186_07390, partial [Planctomycetota bacterium]|nr:hypothetical protein [Planctomycetota bacterium]
MEEVDGMDEMDEMDAGGARACRAMENRHGWRCHVHFVHSVHFARWLSGFFRLHCGNACRHRIIRQVVA